MNLLQIYKILEVSPGVGFETVKKSYRKLVKQYHPDLNKSKDAAKQFDRIQNAFEIFKSQFASGKYFYQKGPVQDAVDIFPKKFNMIHQFYLLGRSLLQEKNPLKRIEIIQKLVSTRKKSAYTFIRKGLWDHDDRVVEQAILGLGELNMAQSGAELTALYLRSSTQIRQVILETLENMENIKAFNNLLIAAMKDSNKSLKKKAVLMFAKKYFS